MYRRLVLLYKLDSRDPAFLSSFYPLERIRAACRERGIALDFSLAMDAEADFDSFRERSAGERTWLRGYLPETLLARLGEARLDCFNDPAAISRIRDKARLARFLESLDVPRPATLDPGDRGALAQALPLIVKPRLGMMGRGVRLVESEAQLELILDGAGEGAAPRGDLVFQEYVSQSRGRDYRAFVCRGRLLAAMLRESDGLLSNVHSGARARPAELSPRWAGLAVDLAREAGLEYAAVDFLERGPDDLLVCEINTAPGFEALEKACGADIAGSVIDLCFGGGGKGA